MKPRRMPNAFPLPLPACSDWRRPAEHRPSTMAASRSSSCSRSGRTTAVEHVAGRRDGAQGVGRALPGVRGRSTSSSRRAENDGAAQVHVQVPRLPRGLRALARGRRVERFVGKVEVDRAPPAARARARDDLHPRSLAAAVGPERSRIDDDQGNSGQWLVRWQGLMHERAKRHSLVEHPPKNAKWHSPSVGARIAPDAAGQRVRPPADGLRLGQDIALPEYPQAE